MCTYKFPMWEVIGLGKAGIAAARLALVGGASVLAIDQNEDLEPLEQNSLFEKHSSVKTILGHIISNLPRDADKVVVSPGVPLENYGLPLLSQSGKHAMSKLEFAAEVLPRCTKILAITGTNGKSTVATFSGQMLNHSDVKTFIGGNIGTPLSELSLQCIQSAGRDPIFKASMLSWVAVVEISSYQLELLHKYFCPSVAVILNLTLHHLEKHKTMENYVLMKCWILSHMNNCKMGVLPLGNQYLNDAVWRSANDFNPAWIGAYPGVRLTNIRKCCIVQISYRLIRAVGQVSELQLGAMETIGAHNYHNAAVAALSVIGLDIGIDAEKLSSAIGKLKVPPHRMQIVHRDNHGVIWVDDGKATNVKATYTGLMGHKIQKLVVLLGGLAKFGYSGMMIQKTLSANGLSIPCMRATTLEDAVNKARTMATYGDAIVLSLGRASFDEFKNFEHRGMSFQGWLLHKNNSVYG
ncbi:UDP-N-acetylmuramoyl-L-alanine--D-glutamate ligase [Bertholletia excelsa]